MLPGPPFPLSSVVLSCVFWPRVAFVMGRQTRADANARAKRGGWRRTLRFLFIPPGALRHAIGEWFDYFRPGFHPWQHDNRQYLGDIEPLLRDLDRSGLPRVA